MKHLDEVERLERVGRKVQELEDEIAAHEAVERHLARQVCLRSDCRACFYRAKCKGDESIGSILFLEEARRRSNEVKG